MFSGLNFAEVSQMSSRLTSESRIYADKAKDLNRQVSFLRSYTYIFSVLIFQAVASRYCNTLYCCGGGVDNLNLGVQISLSFFFLL